MRPLLPPEALWLRTDELNAELCCWPRIQLKTDSLADKAANTNLAFRTLPDLAVQAQQKSPLDGSAQVPGAFTGPVVFSVESEGRREALGELLGRIKLRERTFSVLQRRGRSPSLSDIGNAETSVISGYVPTNLALICESDLLGERVARLSGQPSNH